MSGAARESGEKCAVRLTESSFDGKLKRMYFQGINVQHPGGAGYKTMVRRYSGREKVRFWELDFVRGLCVLLMVFDHFMYCMWDVMPAVNSMLGTDFLAGMQKTGLWYWNWEVRNNVRVLVITAFFVLCGISCTLTRGNFRRSISLLLVAWGITCVTSIVDNFIQGAKVQFGVIHMLGVSVLVYAILDEAAQAVGSLLGTGKVSRAVKAGLRYFPGIVGCIWLIWLFSGYAKIEDINGFWTILPIFDAAGASSAQKDIYSILLYVKNYTFNSGDYFPILPWGAIVLVGGIIGRLVYHTSVKYAFKPLDGQWNKPLCFLGRHAAVIYVSHMVVIPALLALCAWISSFFG